MTGMDRRQFMKMGAAVVGGAIGLGLLDRRAVRAFPPDWITDNFTRMCYHENPIGPHPEVYRRVGDLLAGTPGRSINRFPDDAHQELKAAILRYNGVLGLLDTDHVLVGVGSTEALMMCAYAFLTPERAVLTEWPTYGIFFGRVEQIGAPIVKVWMQRRPDGRYLPDLEGMRAALAHDPRIKLIHFNVINNPLGSHMSKADFDAFVLHVTRSYPETIIIADDSDPEFRERRLDEDFPRPIEHILAGRNVIHIQTFSHIFGMTGLRLGYAIAPRHLIECMHTKRISRGTSVAAVTGGLVSLEYAPEQIERAYANNHAGRLWLYEQLEAMGLEYLRSQGAYIMLNTGIDSAIVYLLMASQKVLIRQGTEWDFPTWIRVNPGLHPVENRIFIEGLKRALLYAPRSGRVQDVLDTPEGRQGANIGWRHGFLPLSAQLKAADNAALMRCLTDG